MRGPRQGKRVSFARVDVRAKVLSVEPAGAFLSALDYQQIPVEHSGPRWIAGGRPRRTRVAFEKRAAVPLHDFKSPRRKTGVGERLRNRQFVGKAIAKIRD